MARILILALLLLTVKCQSVQAQGSSTQDHHPWPDSLPVQCGWINDLENLFTPEQEKLLDSLVRDFKKRTRIEIAIVTLDTGWVRKERFDDFVLKIHNAWGVGEKETHNGMVIGISAGHRQIRISNGYGIEKILSDRETKIIIDQDFIPLFREADYFGGTLNGLKAIIRKLEEKIHASSRK